MGLIIFKCNKKKIAVWKDHLNSSLQQKGSWGTFRNQNYH